VVITASSVDIDFDLKVKKGVEATNILQPEKLNNYEPRNLWYECSKAYLNLTFESSYTHFLLLSCRLCR